MLRNIVNRCSSGIFDLLFTDVKHLSPFPPTPAIFLPLFSRFSESSVLSGRRQHNNEGNEINSDPDAPLNLFVVQPRLRPDALLKVKLDEALNLANSLENQRDGYYASEFLDKETPPHLVVQDPSAKCTHADTYFGVGTVETVKIHVNELETKNEVDAIFVNATLSGVQQRNLEKVWGKPVLDRVGLIIEIFNAHAQTKEAKLQAELAALMYKRSRLVRVRGLDGRYTFGGIGEAEVVSARGRGSGGRGFISGAGETELQLQRRRILERQNKLLSEIKDVRRTRMVQRAARKRHGCSPGREIATVALVGYTNAGKSTLASTLSDSYFYCDDRLFATVDPKLSSVILPSGRKVLLSDTVGFISDLPIQLVEAFHATLEEVVQADLLVHVLDSSAPNMNEHRHTVLEVLEQIGVPEEKIHNMIEVWNKIDLRDAEVVPAELDSEDYVSNSSDEDSNTASDQLQGQDESDLLLLAREPAAQEITDGTSNNPDNWTSSRDEDSWIDYSSNTVGCETLSGKPEPFIWNWKTAFKGCHSEQESILVVKTDAISGTGLQELLKLIDDKLPSIQVVERSIFNRKWRPKDKEITG